ncbi:MAG: biotin--[acetyl-CoA-carboxylase] ligase [Deltaproteobacteria bacterium]|nr:biotin--[acetyl-CoA-carboxylase] ligase [Deltaproteobacteria bacterium]
MPAVDILQIKKNLKTSRFGQAIHFEPSIDSTNNWALSGIDFGAKCGEVFLTDFQTRGHGRQDRVWESTKGKNILMSLIDEAPRDSGKIFQLTLVAGVAFQEALASLFPSLDIQLKWPNDLLVYPEREKQVERVKGKKLAGILCEKHSSRPTAVIGVGINVNSTEKDFSEPVGGLAASLTLQIGSPVNREEVISACLNAYEKWRKEYDRFGLNPIRTAWLEKTDMMGKKVRVIEGEKIVEGTVNDLDKDGFLVVDGKKVISGDVIIL